MRIKPMSRMLIALGGLLLSVWGLRVAWTARALQNHLAQVEQWADVPDQVDPRSLCDLVRDLRADVVTLDQDAGVLARLAPAFGWLPRWGGDWRAAPHLLAAADGLTEAGTLACASLAPILQASDASSTGFSIEQIVALLAANQSDLERAAVALDRAQAAWARVDTGQLSSSLARRARLIERGMPLLRAGLVGLTVAPDLFGVNGERTYLIIAQNEDELRPTGGFITGVGEVKMRDGRLVEMSFRDSYAVDDFAEPYPEPPEPLRRYMLIDQWVFRDSNWSPDFPTAMRQALALYRPGHSVRVDGVIAIDQTGLQELLGALGPLTVQGESVPITGANVIAYIRRAWEPPGGKLTGAWWKQRKSFMGPLAEAVWERIQGGQFDAVALGMATLRMLEQKHLLVYLSNPRAAIALAENGWDGSLPAPSGDALMVVDANIGYNKTNPRVRESLSYEVDLRARPPIATLSLTYTHTSRVNYPCKPEIRYDPIYEQAMERCYFDYIRIYVPQGSQLLDATRLPVSGESLFSGKSESGAVAARLAEEGPWTVFEVMGVLPTASSQTRVFTWSLPASVVKWGQADGWYSLQVQKQPGTLAHPLTVRVRLPENCVLIEVMPGQVEQEGDWVVYRTTLERDQKIRMHFRRIGR